MQLRNIALDRWTGAGPGAARRAVPAGGSLVAVSIPMNRIAALSLLLLASCMIGAVPDSSGDPEPAPDPVPSRDEPGARRMIGYFASWDVYDRAYNAVDIPVDRLTVINYAFTNISDAGECVLGDPYADIEKVYPGDSEEPGALRGNIHQLQLLRQAQPHLKLLFSVGGWTLSTNFSDAALTAESRARFARSCVALVDRYGFDGLDIDWEYPGGGGLAPGRPEDTTNFTLLLAELRAQLGSRLLTIAAPANPAQIAKIEVAKIAAILDWVNVMAYDFHGSYEFTTNFGAPLAHVSSDPTTNARALNVTAAIDTWLAGGLAADKLVLGMPTYGYGWSGVGSSNDGLFQAASSIPMGTWVAGTFEYHDIKARYLPTMTRHWSTEGNAPWLYDAVRGLMISYEDVESLTAKTGLIRRKGLGGAMFWQLSSDDADHTLVRAVHGELAR